MRLIFSTILAAALVFGGTLFLAGYFDGIELRDEPHEVSANTDEDVENEDRKRGASSHCPSVERIMAGSIPKIFDVTAEDLALFREGKWVTVGDFKYYERGTEWNGVALSRLFEVGDRQAKGKTIECIYRNPDRAMTMDLTLVPDLYSEIEFEMEAEGGWHRAEGGWRRVYGSDCAAPAFGCRGSNGECGFFVHRADAAIRDIKTREDEPCDWPPLEPPEVSVERGGRPPGGRE